MNFKQADNCVYVETIEINQDIFALKSLLSITWIKKLIKITF